MSGVRKPVGGKRCAARGVGGRKERCQVSIDAEVTRYDGEREEGRARVVEGEEVSFERGRVGLPSLPARVKGVSPKRVEIHRTRGRKSEYDCAL
jgi:hypothetical protein